MYVDIMCYVCVYMYVVYMWTQVETCYHGSPLENWYGILHQGLLARRSHQPSLSLSLSLSLYVCVCTHLRVTKIIVIYNDIMMPVHEYVSGTSKQRHGAVYGWGIYLARQLDMARTYAQTRITSIPKYLPSPKDKSP